MAGLNTYWQHARGSMDKNTVLFWSDESPESIDDAKKYIHTHKLTRDDVRLIKKEGEVMVISKRGVWGG